MANKNVERYLKAPIHYFNLIGFEFEEKNRWMKIRLIAGILNMSLAILGQMMVFPLSEVEFQERIHDITLLNYYLVSVGKIVAWLYNQKTIREVLNKFREIYPSAQQEKEYNLRYMKTYLTIERILARFFQSITLFFNFYPLVLSLLDLLRVGVFGYRMSLTMWLPTAVYSNWLLYLCVYMQQVCATYMSAIIILGTDLCLFSSLLQLCMHFDMINRNILKIEPDASKEAEKQLKILIAYHQMVLRLADKVNDVFTPSVMFSLLSSSCIICFTGYQLLGDISLLILVRVIFLLCYEMKQVIITCFLSDSLIEISLKTADAIYEHKWYNGTPKYKRLVLIGLIRSQKRAALNIAGISDVSRQTLREVMSISYQIFTVLKTT